jgi:dsRNA-specific ribonuclease
VSYNRLAMLGDANLTTALTNILFDLNPPLEPGEMTELRNIYISNANVANWGKAYGFNTKVNIATHVVLSTENMDRFSGGSFEAYLAALALSESQETLTEFIKTLVEPSLDSVRQRLHFDYKKPKTNQNALQLLNSKLTLDKIDLPEYRSVQNGDGVEASFEVKCVLYGKVVAQGNGRNIKEAKRRAAEHVLAKPAKFWSGLRETAAREAERRRNSSESSG